MINRLLRRITIRSRVISLLVLLLVILAGFFTWMIKDQIAVANRLTQVTERNAQVERNLLLASTRVLSTRINLMRYTMDSVPNPGEALGDVDQAKDLLTQASSAISGTEQATAIDAAIIEIDEYKILIGKVQTARSEGMENDVSSLLVDVYQKELDIEQRIESIVAENAQRMEDENAAELARVQRQLIFIILCCVAALVLTLVAVILIERSISRPIHDLRNGTESLRSGHLETLIPVTGQDELSWLARTFNQMVAQIAKSYTDMEQRVAERTRAAEARALQLQVAAEVARDAASVSELDSLLFRAVNLIRDRFDFYYVGIYLIDDLSKFAVLRAATGDAGRSFIQREHKIRVGEVGVIGYTTGVGAPRIVNDVDADFIFRREVMLPDTRAELALPLKVGKMVIGALDVQSARINAFGEDDLAALQILADQLAVAIKNMRLVGELEDRLSEINSLYRRYTQDSLSRVTHSSQQLGYQYDLLSLQAGQQRFAPEVLAKLKAGQKAIVQEETQGTVKSRLLAPLMLYDQMIGVLGFDQDDPDHQWSDDEIVIIEAVSNQVILALDNARLLDETQLRTDQLRLLQDITATAAAHTSLKELLDDVSQKLRAGLDVERCVFALIDAEGHAATRFSVASAHALPPGSMTLGIKTPLTQSALFRRALQERRSVVGYDDKGILFLTTGSGIPSQPPIYSVVVIPLVVRDVVVGLIMLESADATRQFGAEDLQLFDQLSMQISTAIEVARSVEQSKSRAEREQMVSAVTSRMRATLDVETVLRTAVEEIFHIGDFADVSIYLAAEESVESEG
jgi:GAF domain-containing protein/HAMP domain-containing protein